MSLENIITLQKPNSVEALILATLCAGMELELIYLLEMYPTFLIDKYSKLFSNPTNTHFDFVFSVRICL